MNLRDVVDLWGEHGTKVLGTLAAVVATALLIDGLIPEAHMKYWLFANALLGGATVKRGFTNAATVRDANNQAGFARPLLLALLLAVAVPVALSLQGCTTLGLAQASSFSDRLAYAYGTHSAVLVSATQSLEAGEIGSQDASRVLKVADEARTALDAARVASGAGDVTTAEGRLQLATALLTNLQAYLRAPR